MTWPKVSKAFLLNLKENKKLQTHRKQHANLNKTDKHIFTLKENKKHKHTPSIKKTTTEIKHKLII